MKFSNRKKGRGDVSKKVWKIPTFFALNTDTYGLFQNGNKMHMTGALTNLKKLTLKRLLHLHDSLCESTNPPYFQFGHNMVLLWQLFRTVIKLFFELGSGSKTYLGTYLCKQSTLVLAVQPYLFVFDSTIFWASLALYLTLRGYFFGPLGLFFGVEIKFKAHFWSLPM